MVKTGKWTELEVEQLRVAYEARKPLKIISSEFNRTLMGVNKALKRFGIRTPKPVKKIAAKAVPSTTYHKEKRVRLERGWNTLHDLIEWLKFNDYEVTFLPNLETPFKVNGIKKTAGQLLLIGNRLRIQQKLPIFRIVGVTND